MKLFTISRSPRKLKIIIISAVIVIIVAITVTLVLVLRPKGQKEKIFRGAAVTNGPGCSDIAINIMEKGGTVADAAISGLFCEGVTMPQSMSLGAGFLMTIYNRTTGKAYSLNSREVAPGLATENMFGGNATLSLKGGLSVAVPGELRGYWELYTKFGGGVPWKDIVQPTIDLCYNGIKVNNYFAYVLNNSKDMILANPLLKEIFINPQTNNVWVEGDIYYRPRLGKTLEIIAEEGGDTLHNGSLTSSFVQDIQNHSGIITIEDMNGYRPKWHEPINTTLSGGQTVYTIPLPGSGPVLVLILNILDNYLDLKNTESVENYQKIVETFKFAYAKRTFLGDEDFNNLTQILADITNKTYAEKLRDMINLNSTFNDVSYYGANMSILEDHGTANLCFLAPNGDAITVTSTINDIFGAGFVSESTGIILNDQMDDFSSPFIINNYGLAPSPANYIRPKKQPLSSMCPSIVVDGNGNVELLIGGAGGSKIITSIAQIMVRHLWYGTNLKTACDNKRLHHQLWPMKVDFELLFETEDLYISEGLAKMGHNVSFVDGMGFAAATCITNRDGESVHAVFDKRRCGSSSYL